MCCASRFCTVVGAAAGSRSKQNVQGPVKLNASAGEQSKAPRPRWKPGQEQNPGPENQDSQHMLEQPRGHFPEKRPIGSGKRRIKEWKPPINANAQKTAVLKVRVVN